MGDEPSADLVARWRSGDQQAAAELFRRYAHRLIALARSQLSRKAAGRLDPEDVIQSVYRSFFGDVREGRYEVELGGDLWQLLVTITLHKLNDQLKWHRRAKRTVEREQGYSSEDSLVALQPHVLTREPSPVEAVALADEVEQVMRRLEPLERRALELRLQGYNLEEIAEATQRSLRTTCRVLDRIKQQLAERQEFGAADR